MRQKTSLKVQWFKIKVASHVALVVGKQVVFRAPFEVDMPPHHGAQRGDAEPSVS
jgi:hypothetical protein